MYLDVSAGAIDATTVWYKDLREIKAGRNIKIEFDGHMGRLTLASISESDAGNYECIATNTGGAAKTKADITVQSKL